MAWSTFFVSMTCLTLSVSRDFFGIFDDLGALLRSELFHGFSDAGARNSKNFRGENGRILGAGFANRHGRYGNSTGHLRDRQQRVDSVKTGGDRNADDGFDRLR